jgi:hypothetical protein
MGEKLLSSNELREDLLGCIGVRVVEKPAARSGRREKLTLSLNQLPMGNKTH